jgi:hypothetical protein
MRIFLFISSDRPGSCVDRVGDAYGPTSETASLISRRFSWAVTSTPLRDKIADIKPLLTFLRVEPIASGKANIQRLLDETASFKKREPLLWYLCFDRSRY